MKKTLFKKTLAGIMSAALLFTAMSGMMTSAATSNGTMTVSEVNATVGDATVNVPVAITAAEGVNTVRAEITYPATLELEDVDVDAASAVFANVNSNFKFELVNEPDYAPGKLIVLVEVDSQVPNALAIGLVLTFKVPAEGDYDIELANVTGAKYETEDDVVFALTNGKVTVASGTVHVHTYEYVYSVEGTNCITKKVCSDPECADEQLVATVANVAQTQAPIVASSLAIKFRIRQDAVTGYTNVFGKFTKDTYSGNTFTGVSAPETITAVTEKVSNVDRWTCEYKGIASYEMTCKIHIQIFGTNANGDVVLVSVTDYAFVDYLETRTGTLGAKLDTLLADIAEYGAAAQTYDGKRTDYLANKNIPAGYASALPTTFVNTTNVASGAVAITAAPVLANNVKLRYRFYKSSIL